MESIPGYDDWKTTPPDDPEPASVSEMERCVLQGQQRWKSQLPVF